MYIRAGNIVHDTKISGLVLPFRYMKTKVHELTLINLVLVLVLPTSTPHETKVHEKINN